MAYIKKGGQGGARPGAGAKGPHAGTFKEGHAPINYSKNKPIREALIKICELAPGTKFVPKNNFEVLALSIWEYSKSASPSNPAGFKAIETILDRIEGKVAPSVEELATDKSKQLTIVLPKMENKPSI